ncbi:hypothetical protein F0562_015427 [Nyssa sinensis]|uniref:Uncharacterized protein n=1 Tax=Nyssa sinensis TaxID=561372 RepID=A0A5J4ZH07_9ASTE|nr:hypothetical protein F0562_015427 [Nyssa sinensis]
MASSYAVIENLQEPLQSTKQGVQKESSSSPRWSICKVPENIRNFNEDAYSPHIICIGPFHSSNQKLETMEAHKRLYMNSFLERINETQETMRVCPEAHDCYRGSNYDENSLSERLLLDGCFIVELFLRQQRLVHPTDEDKIIKNPSMIPLLQRDLLLLENQIPFCVLKQLYSRYRVMEKYHIEPDSLFSLPQLALTFFKSSILPYVNPRALGRNYNADIMHLLDLVHKCYEASIKPPRSGCSEDYIKRATQLADAGIQFKPHTSKNIFNIEFMNAVLKIPQLRVDDMTEPLFRNLIALEQCCSERRQLVTSYAALMDRLIDTPQDVEFLEDRSIIRNDLGCSKDVADLFNNLCKGVIQTEDIFSELSAKVNHYCSQLWIKIRATLKRKFFREYFPNPVQFAAFTIAIVALLFTILQTVYTITTYYYTR